MPISRTPISEADLKEKPQKDTQIGKKEPSVSFYETEPKYSFSDIVLPTDVKKDVQRSIIFIRNKNRIFEEWNMKSVVKNYNLCINLYGPSGTGKTMTAHAIAKELGKKIVAVNYAEIESKYVGETSKNLQNLFKYAEERDSVILFDEADALLSKRVTAMHSATDVSVNQTRNTLLKILDEYSGIVIFTTNFIQNYDFAFMRRIFSNIEFVLPNFDARIELWNHYLLQTLPMKSKEDIVAEIAHIEGLSGADISTIVLKAIVEIVELEDSYIDVALLTRIAEEIKKTKSDIQGKYEITTRKVSEAYAQEQLSKLGGSNNGINQ